MVVCICEETLIVCASLVSIGVRGGGETPGYEAMCVHTWRLSVERRCERSGEIREGLVNCDLLTLL